MKKNYILTTILLLSICVFNAQTTWTGANITFTKANNADFTLTVNQDIITNNVSITRGNGQGILNSSSKCNFSRIRN